MYQETGLKLVKTDKFLQQPNLKSLYGDPESRRRFWVKVKKDTVKQSQLSQLAMKTLTQIIPLIHLEPQDHDYLELIRQKIKEMISDELKLPALQANLGESMERLIPVLKKAVPTDKQSTKLWQQFQKGYRLKMGYIQLKEGSKVKGETKPNFDA